MGSATAWSRVEAVVAEVSETGTVGVALIGPDGDRWQHHGDRRFSAASTVKIAIMVEVYRQIDAGRLNLDERYTYKESDRTGGSGVLNHMREGLNPTLSDIIYLMMSISDNAATNMLIRLVGMEAVNRMMQDLGMKNSNLSREMKGRPAEADEEENLATPNDYVKAILAILDGTAASATSCAAMTAMLRKQQNSRRMARYIPRSNKILWGSKTGTSQGVVNEVGFIIAPNGRLILAVDTENFPDAHTAEQVISEIARAAMADTGVVGPLYTS